MVSGSLFNEHVQQAANFGDLQVQVTDSHLVSTTSQVKLYVTNNPPQWDPDPGLAGFDYYIQSTGSPQTIDLHTTDEESDNGNHRALYGLPADISLYATITPTDPKAGTYMIAPTGVLPVGPIEAWVDFSDGTKTITRKITFHFQNTPPPGGGV